MADELSETEEHRERKDDSFQDTLLLMAVFGGRSGTENTMGWEWPWEEGDTRESLMCEASEFADEIAALLDACSEHAPATNRAAVQLVSLRGRLNLGHYHDGTSLTRCHTCPGGNASAREGSA